MSILAIIPSGQTEITVNGLHQWDYGQTLEIRSAELPTIVEVHFACVGMKEAVVRVCEATEGVAEVAIPDRCLEQTTPITAWVYVKDDTTGTTTKTITLPIIPRTRPQPNATTIPEGYYNEYTEVITEFNTAADNLRDAITEANTSIAAAEADALESIDEAVEAFTSGAKVPEAFKADTATNATYAVLASNAELAESINVSTTSNVKLFTVNINNGSGTIPGDYATLIDSLVLLELDEGTGNGADRHSGVAFWTDMRINLTTIGRYVLEYGGGSGVQFRYQDETVISVPPVSGVLYITKIGGRAG